MMEIPEVFEAEVFRLKELWVQEERTKRIWRGESSVWTGAGESAWLEWLEHDIFNLDARQGLAEFRELVRRKNFRHVILLGMGGASLTAEVIEECFSAVEGFPSLHVVNTLDSQRICYIDEMIDYRKTLFVVSSKSGATLETLLLFRYFADRFSESSGGFNGGHFVAITDNGTQLDDIATSRKFQKVFSGSPGIGGRFSALSVFGQVPACALGLDLGELLNSAESCRKRCAPDVPAMQNDGLVLGLLLAAAVESGRDKITFVISPRFSRFGNWVEQLLGESTGKNETGVIPITSERLGGESVYGKDRVFIYLRDSQWPDEAQDAGIERLREIKQPLVQLDIKAPYELGAQFFQWQFATVVAASVLKINPFTQPDVEASKVEAQRLIHSYGSFGSREMERVAPGATARMVIRESMDSQTAENKKWIFQIKKFLSCIRDGDYLVFLSFLAGGQRIRELLSEIQHGCRDNLKIPTNLACGPEYLHSTGQMHKGGKNTGVFILITCDDAQDIPVIGYEYTFGMVRKAQAESDLKVLQEKGRRILHVHIASDSLRGVELLAGIFKSAIKSDSIN